MKNGANDVARSARVAIAVMTVQTLRWRLVSDIDYFPKCAFTKL